MGWISDLFGDELVNMFEDKVLREGYSEHQVEESIKALQEGIANGLSSERENIGKGMPAGFLYGVARKLDERWNADDIRKIVHYYSGFIACLLKNNPHSFYTICRQGRDAESKLKPAVLLLQEKDKSVYDFLKTRVEMCAVNIRKSREGEFSEEEKRFFNEVLSWFG